MLQGCDQLSVAAHEPDSPSSHVVAFRHGEEFDCYFLGTLHLENRWGSVFIEHKIGICKIMNDPEAVFHSQFHNLFEKA